MGEQLDRLLGPEAGPDEPQIEPVCLAGHLLAPILWCAGACAVVLAAWVWWRLR